MKKEGLFDHLDYVASNWLLPVGGYSANEVQLDPGDTVVLYTDGITELQADRTYVVSIVITAVIGKGIDGYREALGILAEHLGG